MPSFVKVSCGARSFCAIDVSGKLYTWGFSTHGMLGQTNPKKYFLFPTLVQGLDDY